MAYINFNLFTPGIEAICNDYGVKVTFNHFHGEYTLRYHGKRSKFYEDDVRMCLLDKDYSGLVGLIKQKIRDICPMASFNPWEYITTA